MGWMGSERPIDFRGFQSAAVGDLSFNQVVEKVLTYDPNSTESDNEAG